ncbi:MAG: PLP-dependent transferase, partial [Rickettsiales bacterium]
EPVAEIAHAAGIPLIVDNTLATPYLLRPFDWGADIVVHSTTKFLSGNGSSLGGCVVDSGQFDFAGKSKFPSLSEPAAEYHGLTFAETFGDLAYTMHSHAVGLRDLGACQSPINAWITLMGIETLPLRMERHCENALEVAGH